MLKLVFCVRRLAETSSEDFRRYWLEEHGALVRSVGPTLNMVRYVQSHGLQDGSHKMLRASRGSAEAYDGIAEVWWDDMEAFNAGVQTPEGLAAATALLEDEARFIDLKASCLFLAEEHEIIDRRE
jgi:uncharacterized protein (TIGR02118 family)